MVGLAQRLQGRQDGEGQHLTALRGRGGRGRRVGAAPVVDEGGGRRGGGHEPCSLSLHPFSRRRGRHSAVAQRGRQRGRGVEGEGGERRQANLSTARPLRRRRGRLGKGGGDCGGGCHGCSGDGASTAALAPSRGGSGEGGGLRGGRSGGGGGCERGGGCGARGSCGRHRCDGRCPPLQRRKGTATDAGEAELRLRERVGASEGEAATARHGVRCRAPPTRTPDSQLLRMDESLTAADAAALHGPLPPRGSREARRSSQGARRGSGGAAVEERTPALRSADAGRVRRSGGGGGGRHARMWQQWRRLLRWHGDGGRAQRLCRRRASEDSAPSGCDGDRDRERERAELGSTRAHQSHHQASSIQSLQTSNRPFEASARRR